MKTRKPGCHTGLLVLALVWQSGDVQARVGADFLSYLNGVEVPSPVPPPVPATKIKPSPVRGEALATQAKIREQAAARVAVTMQENRRLKALLARLEQKLRAQEAATYQNTTAHNAGQVQQTELASQLSALHRQLTQQTSDLKAAEEARDSLAQEVKQLQLKNHTLSAKVDTSNITATPDPALSAALKQSREALPGVEKQLTDRPESLRQARAQSETLTESLAALRKQYDALSAEWDGLRGTARSQQKQIAVLIERAGEANRQITALTAQRDALQKTVDEQKGRDRDAAGAAQQKETVLNKQLSDLQGVQAALRSQLTETGQKNGALAQQLSAITVQRDTLQQALAKSEQSAAVLTQQMDALKAGQATSAVSAGEEAAALQKRLTEAQQQNTALKAEGETAAKQVTALQGKVDTLTQQLAGLHTSGEKATPAPAPDSEKPTLTTDVQRQTYASGVVFADNLKRTLALQKNLGITPDPVLLLAGLTDAMHESVRLDGPTLDTSYQALINRLASLEEKKYQTGEKTLEKLASGPALLKRNRSVFFVQNRKGRGGIRPGDAVQFDMTESVVKGKVLRDTKGLKATLDDKLPYLVSQALTLAGQGGSITVYCMASDVYQPEQVPEGLFAYSLLKYTFTVKDK
ncbi:coiled-coil domain-containing protein [Enterobacter hormaechei]|uniref:hypothetical protein n=1 Tax=Enterobacter hormaechei TaxID=158836 RepID=UPI0032B0BF4C